jgi:F-type H+-transporting ATPase subunit gamma
MLPQLMRLKFYAAVLDSEASEHAARTIAMQTASDNAEDLLGELTLEYNKGRQQKITAERLDLVGGSRE